MRRKLLLILLLTCFLMWGWATAHAVGLYWTFLKHASVANKGPGPDALIGTSDDTNHGENNTCNFTVEQFCTLTGSPSVGSYSYAAIEFRSDMVNSCLYGDTPGEPCIAGPCSPLGDYCPGDGAICVPCNKSPTTWDSFTYFGPKYMPPSSTMITCQEYDGPEDPNPLDSGGQTEFQIFDFYINLTELAPGTGSGMLHLSNIMTDFIGGPCGLGPISGSFDVYIASFDPFMIPMPFTGDVIDMDDPSASSCGYTVSDLNTMIANARSIEPSAEHLMIVCGSSTIPNDNLAPCMAGASFDFVFVVYTANDVTQCPDNGCSLY